MPIASQREDVRMVACASNSPRIPIEINPPRTIRGSENRQNALGNNSKPEYQLDSAICVFLPDSKNEQSRKERRRKQPRDEP